MFWLSFERARAAGFGEEETGPETIYTRGGQCLTEPTQFLQWGGADENPPTKGRLSQIFVFADVEFRVTKYQTKKYEPVA